MCNLLLALLKVFVLRNISWNVSSVPVLGHKPLGRQLCVHRKERSHSVITRKTLFRILEEGSHYPQQPNPDTALFPPYPKVD